MVPASGALSRGRYRSCAFHSGASLEHETRLDIVYVSGTGPFGEFSKVLPSCSHRLGFSSAHSNGVVWHRQGSPASKRSEIVRLRSALRRTPTVFLGA